MTDIEQVCFFAFDKCLLFAPTGNAVSSPFLLRFNTAITEALLSLIMHILPRL